MNHIHPTQTGTDAAARGADHVIITLGFTQSNRDAGYSSFSDGYRLGAQQMSVTVVVDGDGLLLTGEEWADEAFAATNQPGQAPAGPARAIQRALADQVRTPLRSLSVGDTVTVHGQMWACEPDGWRLVDGRGGDGEARRRSLHSSDLADISSEATQ
jgi:hypothetical protein